MAVADLAKKQPNIGWTTLLDNLGAKTDSIDISQPAYYSTLNTLLKSISINDWKVYLKAYSLNNYSNALSKPLLMLRLTTQKLYLVRLCKKHVERSWQMQLINHSAKHLVSCM
jgi:predicted metalloendopeptidase